MLKDLLKDMNKKIIEIETKSLELLIRLRSVILSYSCCSLPLVLGLAWC
jgi:hypothetical protein